ncbi:MULTISPECIES: imidazole glycerol phosphate synthase subunit HisH [Haematobacter]|uniref:Imidazole glycerol phosphate synthase subunit HisH n=1 Tax=Haematobacter genomosp. 1 TaxID=366618 RepID=A0A212AD47_9RHOB|nr:MULTISPECIES: imidazole glycerol phosphate synthase subunit HisH [Haematobacter]OWJ78904.1 imidazole glycerol phosphate synthase subunit HisH [Haematobacter genomosp. 1]
MLVALVDYDSGNLHSAEKAFQRMAAEVGRTTVTVTSDPDVVARADRIVLPGDGAFPACREALEAHDGLFDAISEAVRGGGRPFLGICVGMQMLASRGLEYQPTAGFDWIPGEVRRIAPADPALKVPHMGWNELRLEQSHPVLDGIASGEHVYFVHSYQLHVADAADRLASADYGGPVTAIVGRGNVIGTQFHPEKSQETGLRLIHNFLDWTP